MQEQWKFTRILVGALVLAISVRAASASPNEVIRQDERLEIAFSVPGLQFDYFLYMLNIASQRAAGLNVDLVNVDGQVDPAVQSEGILAMIAQGVDGIIVSPLDDASLLTALQAAQDAGIPVVTIDRGENIPRTVAHVGADNVRGGEIQAEYLRSLMPTGGDIIEIQGFLGTSPADDRSKGFNDAIAQYSDIEVVTQEQGQFFRDTAIDVTEQALREHPNADAIVCANDDMCLGSAQVVNDLGLDTPIIGFDAIPEALRAVQRGDFVATVDQWTGRQAAHALNSIVDYVRTGAVPSQRTTLLEPTLITTTNVGTAERAAEAGIEPAGTPAAAMLFRLNFEWAKLE